MTSPTRPPLIARPLWRMAARIIATGAVLALLLGMTACGGVEVVEHSASISLGNSLIAEVQVALSGEARVFVEYENPDAGKFRTALSELGTAHNIPVVRLRPETVYEYAIGIQDGDGDVAYGASGEFTTGPLPPELAAMQIRVAGRSTLPLIATDYRAIDNAYYIFWDETGNIVWYYVHKNIDGFLQQGRTLQTIRQKSNGNLMYMSYQCCLTEITPLGELVDQITASGEAGIPRHDFRLLDDGRILYPSFINVVIDDSANGGNAETVVWIDELLIWDQRNGMIESVWDSRDFWEISDPGQRVVWQEDPKRWTHINSVSVGERGNFMLSARNRRQVISLSPDFQSIEWQLGGPGSDYSFPDPRDRFYGQHTASQLTNGNILVFDNGTERPDSEDGEYSRALELRLDNDNRTAVKVWEYRSSPELFSRIVSSAFRLDNGNTLVNFGYTRMRELMALTFVEADPQGNDVFRVETFRPGIVFDDTLLRYHASGDIAAIMGETMLRPPADRPAGGQPAFSDWVWWPVQEIEARLAGLQPVARERFDLYIDNNRVVYRKEQCAVGETADNFLLHVFPEDPADLPDESREVGFENLDFEFRRRGIIRDGKCLAVVPLPDYPIARIRTGQYEPGGERLWRAEFAGP